MPDCNLLPVGGIRPTGVGLTLIAHEGTVPIKGPPYNIDNITTYYLWPLRSLADKFWYTMINILFFSNTIWSDTGMDHNWYTWTDIIVMEKHCRSLLFISGNFMAKDLFIAEGFFPALQDIQYNALIFMFRINRSLHMFAFFDNWNLHIIKSSSNLCAWFFQCRSTIPLNKHGYQFYLKTYVN